MQNYTLSASEAAEVTFMTGVNSNGALATQSFWTWNQDDPATYGTTEDEAKWGSPVAGAGATISYSFNAASNWTATEENAFIAAMALWSEVANVTFVQVNAGGDFTITRGSDKSAEGGITELYRGTIGSSQLGSAVSGSVSIDTSVAAFGPIGASLSDYGGYPWQTIIHELGHVLGLGHAGAYDEGVTQNTPAYGPYDSRQWSVMSYITPTDVSWGSSLSDNGRYYGNVATTPMQLDILAVQQLYGLPTSTPLSGGQIFGFGCNVVGSTEPFFDFTKNTQPIVTIWDEGANNTLNLSGFAQASTVNLNAGTFSSCAGLTQNLYIALGTQVDTAIGGAGADNLTANNDGDVLTGGAGANTYYGGTGNDTIKDTQADLNGNVIQNLHIGDKIDFTDAQLAGFSYVWNGSTLSYGPGDSLTLLNYTGGHFVLSADPSGGVDLTLEAVVSLAHPVANLMDFNGDGSSDLVWRNVGGAFSEWQSTGAGFTQNVDFDTSVPASWTLSAVGDFNGDGKSDLIWRNSDGSLSEWQSTGNGFTANVYTASVATNWQIVGAADFNGDGMADLLWRSSDGSVSEWRSTGSGFAQNAYTTSVPTNWQVAGVGDFNGDGLGDILWRSADGTISEWQSTGSGFTQNVFVTTVPTVWHVIAIGDFNGDGKADLLWENGAGAISEWQSTGAGFTQNVFTTTVPASWSLTAVGDYNGDGMADLLWRHPDGTFSVWESTGSGFTQNVITGSAPSGWATYDPLQPFVVPTYSALNNIDFNGDGQGDLLWRNTNGAFSEWQSTGTGFVQNVDFDTSVPSSWTLAQIGDFNGDGRSDLVWTNASTGQLSEWQSTGSTFSQNVFTATLPSGWAVVGSGDFNGDGFSDLLLRNASTGQVSVWQSTGSNFDQNAFVTTVASAWSVAGTGDFNGDGKADILWTNASTGQVSEWQSLGSGFNQNVFTDTVPAGWSVAAVGDFDGDGKSDLIWTNASTGQVSEWRSTGSGFTENVFTTAVPAGWSVVAVGDFNGDGKADLVWENTSGAFSVWESTGTGFNQNVITGNVAPGWTPYDPSHHV